MSVRIFVKGIGHTRNWTAALLITKRQTRCVTTTPNAHVTRRWEYSTLLLICHTIACNRQITPFTDGVTPWLLHPGLYSLATAPSQAPPAVWVSLQAWNGEGQILAHVCHVGIFCKRNWTDWELRLSTSAPTGDPDLYLWVYRLTESTPRFGQVIRHRWPRLAGQVLAEKTGTCHGSQSNGYLQVLTSTQRYSWVSLKNDCTET